MSQERWDIVLKLLHGPLAPMGEMVFRGPIVRVGADPGPGGFKLTGYRGLDARQCVITAYTGGSVALAPVGTNQVRLAPHANVNWKEIEPLRGPAYLSKEAAIHLGPIGRGATIEFVDCRRLGVWKKGRLASEADDISGIPEPQIGGRGATASSGLMGGGGSSPPPASYSARRVGKVQASRAPMWFLGCVFLMVLTTSMVLIGGAVWDMLQRDVVALGPVEEGDYFYESVDLDRDPLSEGLMDGLEQPFYDFIMEPNQRLAGSHHTGLKKSENWDQRFYQYTVASIQQKWVKGWTFFSRLDAVKKEFSTVTRMLSASDVPVVLAAMPYQESRYKHIYQSPACADGYWQFMPEVALRVRKKGGIDMRVEQCRFKNNTSDYRWSPTMLTPPRNAMKNAEYINNGQCQIEQGSCRPDDRQNLKKSTQAAIYTLGEPLKDSLLMSSGSAVQIAIISHHTGYDDSRYGVPKPTNVLPAYKKWIKKQGNDMGPSFYGEIIRAPDHTGNKRHGSPFEPGTQHYGYNIVAQFIVAVCYYASNYPEDPSFKPWVKYTKKGAYCSEFDVPTADEVRNRRRSKR